MAMMISYAVMLISLFALNRREGMKIESRTALACVLPLILLLNNILMAAIYFILIICLFTTNIIITKHEKGMLLEKLKTLALTIKTYRGID